SRAHARADEDRHQASPPPGGASDELSPGSRPNVVLDDDRDAKGLFQARGQRDVAPAEVRRVDHGTGHRIDLTGTGDAEGERRVGRRRETGDERMERRDHGLRSPTGVRGPFGVRQETAVGPDDTGPDVGAADIDADDVSY